MSILVIPLLTFLKYVKYILLINLLWIDELRIIITAACRFLHIFLKLTILSDTNYILLDYSFQLIKLQTKNKAEAISILKD